MLYQSSSSSLVVAIVVAALLAYVLNGAVHQLGIILWAAVFLIAYIGRKLLAVAYHRRSSGGVHADFWLKWFRITTGCCGFSWGLAGLILFPSEPGHQAFLAIALAGVVGGAIVVYSIDTVCSVAFSAGLTLPAVPRFFIHSSPSSVVIGLMIILFVVYVTAAGRRLSKSIRENILLRISTARSEHELAVFAQRQKLHIESTPMGVIEWNVDSTVTLWNSAAEKIFGFSSEEAVGQHIHFIVAPVSQKLVDDTITTMLEEDESQCFIHENLRKDGEIIYCEWFNTPLKDQDGTVIGWASLVQDKTAFKKAQEEVYQLAYFDVLTNLPNRRLLLDRLNLAMISSKRANSYSAVLFMDLDNFKVLNDTKGHAVGDMLLQEVAARLQRTVRGNDTVARIGGDEFVIVLNLLGPEHAQAEQICRAIAEKIIHEINRPYHLNAHEHHSSPSVGICLFLGQEISVEEILKRADSAMYQAKQAGRNNMQFFNPSLQPALDLRASLQNDLRLALPNQQLQMYYQVQVDQHFNTAGAEVLIRWIHPQQGPVSPAEFIPLAEESGQIVAIGTWVLRESCRQLKAWESSAHLCNLRLSVNVSARQFGQADFVNQVQQALLNAGCRPERLRLELTESLVVQNIDDVIGKMQELKEIGVSLAMDDFGTGYSSLSVLKRLPLDELKIDQGFVRDILDDIEDSVIVQTIIAMGKNLGLEVIAEGVETSEQAVMLRQFGCMSYQGYLFGKPLPIDRFEESILRSKPEDMRVPS